MTAFDKATADAKRLNDYFKGGKAIGSGISFTIINFHGYIHVRMHVKTKFDEMTDVDDFVEKISIAEDEFASLKEKYEGVLANK